RQRCGFAPVEEHEVRLVDIEREDKSGVDRTVLRHHKLRDEDLEPRNETDHAAAQHGRLEQRERDISKKLYAGRSIDPRGFVVVGRYVLQTGEEDHHKEADLLPDTHDHYGLWRQIDVGEPVAWLLTDRRKEKGVEEALPVKDQFPDYR